MVEFVDGSMKVKRGNDSLVMTNEPGLNWQLNNRRRYKPFGGTLPLPGDIDPPSRFVRASAYLSTLPKAASADDAEANLYGVMKNVAVPAGARDYSSGDSEDTWMTLWTTIANLSQGHYGIQLNSDPDPVWVTLKHLHWNGSGMRVLPLRGIGRTGDVSELLTGIFFPAQSCHSSEFMSLGHKGPFQVIHDFAIEAICSVQLLPQGERFRRAHPSPLELVRAHFVPSRHEMIRTSTSYSPFSCVVDPDSGKSRCFRTSGTIGCS